MSPTERFDVAIAGAGPAGARAAYRMARAGARVAILDGSHPREKPCGGGVTGRALELVRDAVDTGPPSSPASASPAQTVDLSLRRETGRFSSVDIESATFEHRTRLARVAVGAATGSPRLVVASRREFDAALLAAATGAGARLVPARVTDITRERDSWLVATADGAIRAEWLLGADGSNSLVRRRVFRPFARADLSIATGFFVRGRTSREIAIAFHDDPPGYLWSFPRPDHLAVGACAQADESSSTALLSLVSRWIERLGDGPMALDRYSWPIPSLRARTFESEQPAGARWMLLGDAGGMVDPITREGIYFALVSADAAADSLLGAGDPAARYTERIRRTIYAELVRAARLKARFFNPRFTGLLVHALERSARIRAVTSDLIAGHQDHRGLRRRLLATFEVGLMVNLLIADWQRCQGRQF